MIYSKEELLEAKRQIASTLHKLREVISTLEGKETPARYQSQITLAKHRIQAFTIAMSLIERELEQRPRCRQKAWSLCTFRDSGLIWAPGSVPAEKLSNTSLASSLPRASAIWLRQELWTQRNATLGFFRPAAEKGQRLPMHWLFRLLYEQTGTVRFISTPRCSRTKSTAARIARKESRLQHRGPPALPIFSRARAVI